MLMELREYLVLEGWAEDIADEIHDAYYAHEMAGVRLYAKTISDDEHDYEDEIVTQVERWRSDVGES